MFYKTYDNDPPQIIPKYKALAKKFQDLGYQADVRCYCEKCVAKSPDTLAPIVFSFRAEGMRESLHPLLFFILMYLFIFCLFAISLGLLPQHMEVPRLGVESEL